MADALRGAVPHRRGPGAGRSSGDDARGAAGERGGREIVLAKYENTKWENDGRTLRAPFPAGDGWVHVAFSVEGSLAQGNLFQQARQNLAAEFRAIEVGQAAGEQDRAFARILATKGRDEQLAMVGRRIDQIRNGPGEMSLRYLRERRGELEDEEQTDTEEYRVIRERMGIQMGRLSALMRTREELRLAPTAGLSDASGVTD